MLPRAGFSQQAGGVRPTLPPGSIAIANAAAPLLTPNAVGHNPNPMADPRTAQQAYRTRIMNAAGASGSGMGGVHGAGLGNGVNGVNGMGLGLGAGGIVARRNSGGLAMPQAQGFSPNQMAMAQGSSPAPLPHAVNQNGKRALSPERTVPTVPPTKTMRVDGQTNGAVPRSTSPTRGEASPEPQSALQSVPRGTVADDDSAGRANLSRPVDHGSLQSKHTQLLAATLVRDRFSRAIRAAGVSLAVDDDAARYLALAAEARVRSIIGSAVRAHDHRVGTSHARAPPLVYKDDVRRFKAKPRTAGDDGRQGASKDSAGKAKPLWAHQVRADPAAVLAKLSERARDENKAHRVARSERNAREFELAKQMAAAAEREGRVPDSARDGSLAPHDDAVSPSAAASGSASTSGAADEKPKEITFSAAPTFGAVAPRKPKGGSKKARAEPSAEAQAKMTNVVASNFTGRKRYNWEMGGGAFAPNVPSLLSGKRKKADASAADDDATGAGQAAGTATGAGTAVSSPAAPSPGPSVPALPVPPAKERRRRPATLPARYEVAVDRTRRVRDDAALTRVDVVFALERERGPRGWGGTDEIVDRVWARWGGPYA
ncbi:hypothetical protein Q5752_005724 [Cryptotrichosporon argae]